MSTWYLAQTKPNASHIAKSNLERQGFVVFQPMEKRTIARRARFSDQIRPFFAGYLFVSYPATTAPWSLVNSTYGVTRLVSFGQSPAPVPESVVKELQQACDSDDVLSFDSEISPGTEIEITSGALTNFVGRVERLAPDHRALVLLEFMGQQTRTRVDLAHVRALRHASQPGQADG